MKVLLQPEAKILNIITSIDNLFKNIGRSLVTQKHEPQIEQKRDRHGNLYWQVKDFATNKTYEFDSDRDVRVWIENRYHSF
ncbi:hypothetical protein [Pleurocapsa sp. FMAR1]|uniref:hypothetical protein n=1 Tax=Pleurocapsa sp. FMAR1 TaxID=3040204 RepID=UPI0029C9686E|nr:hypothetical protein [Pleurocapsa sp. FMAR1]